VNVQQHFPESAILKENWRTIRDELESILAHHRKEVPRFHEIDRVQQMISGGDEIPWRVFILKGYGLWLEENCALAPKTTELLQGIPRVTSAMFSILEPHKNIPAHRGFYKGVYRYHLALKVPASGEVFLAVDGQRHHWKEGEDVLFDDSYRHWVKNESDELRVVLFIDVLRDKDLPRWLSRLNRWIFAQRVRSHRLKTALGKAVVNKAA
jgi:beta-hydroxylase